MSMYLDRDARGLYGLIDITPEELSTILTVLSTYQDTHNSDLGKMAFFIFNKINNQRQKIEDHEQLGALSDD